MKTVQVLAVLCGIATVAQAHMEMVWPPAFKSKANPYAGQDIDYSMTAPLKADGSDFPCKGYQSIYGTPEGKSVASWTPGEKYNVSLAGSAIHNGGSCQLSMSYDKAKTWTVVHSYLGNCPSAANAILDFTLPSDTPSGEAIFAWSWENNTGNREFYMNCAAVTIAGGAKKRASSTAFSSRPAMFVVNVGNGCTTAGEKDLQYPDPGPDVTKTGSNFAPPIGKCAAAGSGGGSGGGSGSSTTAVTDPTTAPAQSTATASTASVSVTAPGSEPPAPTTTASTLSTVTKPSAPATPSTPSTPTTPAPTPTGGSSGGAGGFTQGTACTSEGAWNCVGGTQFQRCASGQWSALIAMASGTKCTPGQSDSLVMAKKRSGKRFHAGPRRI